MWNIGFYLMFSAAALEVGLRLREKREASIAGNYWTLIETSRKYSLQLGARSWEATGQQSCKLHIRSWAEYQCLICEHTVTPGPLAPHDGEKPVHYENLSGTRQKLIFGAIISSFVEILGPYVQVERGLTFGNTYLSLIRKASGAIRNTRKHLERT